MIQLGNGRIYVGGGKPVGVYGNPTVRPASTTYPSIEYTYSVDLQDVFWVGGSYHWDFRCQVVVRLRSNDSISYARKEYIRQKRQQDGGEIEQGLFAETNAENDPGDITFTVSGTASAFGAGPAFYVDDVSATLNMEVAEQDESMYYEIDAEVVIARTSTGTNIVAQSGIINNITTGADLDTETQSGTFVQTTAAGQLKFQDETITLQNWVL